jgi:hypothetical protein
LARLRNLRNLVLIRGGDLISGTLVFGLERITQAAIRMRDAFAFMGPVLESITKSIQGTLNRINFEAMFERIVSAVQPLIGPLRTFGDRLARIAIVFNGAAFVAVFATIGVAIDKANVVLGSMLTKLQTFTGLDFSTPERSVAAFAATLEVLPRILDRIRLMGTILQVTFADVFRAIGNFFSKLTTISSTFFSFFAGAVQNMFGFLIPNDVIDAWNEMIATMQTAAGEISTQIGSEIEGMFEDIAEAQKRIKDAINSPEAAKSKAAEGINKAAENLSAALKGDPADILSVEEWVRRLNSATFGAKIEGPQVEQQRAQAEAAQETAKNTRELLSLARTGARQTPLFARSGF